MTTISVRLDEYMYIEGMGTRKTTHILRKYLKKLKLTSSCGFSGDHAEDVAIQPCGV